jgi:hypothetical protein
MARRAAVVAATAALAAALTVATGGCSSTVDKLAVQEGTPVNLGNMEYSNQISRYLNPHDQEDIAYLRGAPPLPPSDNYLGVFLQIHNHGSTPESMPTRYVITDTTHHTYKPVPMNNDFSLPLGGKVGAGGQFPNPESIAANGPIEGSMLLFIIPQSASENRPLTLKIPAAGNHAPGRVQLDI